jgi:hypothetical protein
MVSLPPPLLAFSIRLVIFSGLFVFT